MRIIMYAGKGGVGKTTMSAATGIECARLGHRTLVMSLDVAHSLSDSFDLDKSLMDLGGGQPVPVSDNLWIQELELQRDLEDNWGEVFRYIATLIHTTGIREVLADELAILPGMEEVAALLYINRYARDDAYDVVVLDCAPTGEAMRFLSLPTGLEWYMEKIFNLERNILKVVRPVAKRMTKIPLPTDDYFVSIRKLYERLDGVQELLQDPETTTARLVTNPEKMVIKETQRAFMYFHLFDVTVDAIVLNRILPPSVQDAFFTDWRESQRGYIEEAEACFAPVPIWRVELGRREMIGPETLAALARDVFKGHDPAEVFFRQRAYDFVKEDGRYVLVIRTPFLAGGEIHLAKSSDELIVRVGPFKRFITLPRRMAALEPSEASLEGGYLKVFFGETPDDQTAH